MRTDRTLALVTVDVITPMFNVRAGEPTAGLNLWIAGGNDALAITGGLVSGAGLIFTVRIGGGTLQWRQHSPVLSARQQLVGKLSGWLWALH